MTKLKLTFSVAIITALLAASAPNSASATGVPVVAIPPLVGGGGGGGPGPGLIFVCVGGIIVAAIVANARDNRELTAEEALTCGTLFWLAQPKVVHKKKHKRSRKGYPPISVKG